MIIGTKPHYVNSDPSTFMKSIDVEQEEKRKMDAVFRNERENADNLDEESKSEDDEKTHATKKD